MQVSKRIMHLPSYQAKMKDTGFQKGIWIDLVKIPFNLLQLREHEEYRVLGNNQIPEDDFTPDSFDRYVNMELSLPCGTDGELQYAKVFKRKRDESGNPIVVANEKPILDTHQYEVEWLDGHREEMFVNTIAENIFAQVDDEGNRHVMLQDIVAHRYTDEALSEKDCWVVTHNNLRKRKPTTKGWEICMEWKDGSTTWIPLKDAMDSYPVQLAEYAIAHKLQDRPAFAWWVPFVVQKCERLISKIKTKCWVCTYKFVIEIPKSVKHALELDKKNGNTLWWDAIMLEMKNVRIAFEKFKGEKKDLPIAFQEIKCHIIFDDKTSSIHHLLFCCFKGKCVYCSHGTCSCS
jgi:hypothetical protein